MISEYGPKENLISGLSGERDCENGEGDCIREILFAGITRTVIEEVVLANLRCGVVVCCLC